MDERNLKAHLRVKHGLTFNDNKKEINEEFNKIQRAGERKLFELESDGTIIEDGVQCRLCNKLFISKSQFNASSHRCKDAKTIERVQYRKTTCHRIISLADIKIYHNRFASPEACVSTTLATNHHAAVRPTVTTEIADATTNDKNNNNNNDHNNVHDSESTLNPVIQLSTTATATATTGGSELQHHTAQVLPTTTTHQFTIPLFTRPLIMPISQELVVQVLQRHVQWSIRQEPNQWGVPFHSFVNHYGSEISERGESCKFVQRIKKLQKQRSVDVDPVQEMEEYVYIKTIQGLAEKWEATYAERVVQSMTPQSICYQLRLLQEEKTKPDQQNHSVTGDYGIKGVLEEVPTLHPLHYIKKEMSSHRLIVSLVTFCWRYESHYLDPIKKVLRRLHDENKIEDGSSVFWVAHMLYMIYNETTISPSAEPTMVMQYCLSLCFDENANTLSSTTTSLKMHSNLHIYMAWQLIIRYLREGVAGTLFSMQTTHLWLKHSSTIISSLANTSYFERVVPGLIAKLHYCVMGEKITFRTKRSAESTTLADSTDEESMPRKKNRVEEETQKNDDELDTANQNTGIPEEEQESKINKNNNGDDTFFNDILETNDSNDAIKMDSLKYPPATNRIPYNSEREKLPLPHTATIMRQSKPIPSEVLPSIPTTSRSTDDNTHIFFRRMSTVCLACNGDIHCNGQARRTGKKVFWCEFNRAKLCFDCGRKKDRHNVLYMENNKIVEAYAKKRNQKGNSSNHKINPYDTHDLECCPGFIPKDHGLQDDVCEYCWDRFDRPGGAAKEFHQKWHNAVTQCWEYSCPLQSRLRAFIIQWYNLREDRIRADLHKNMATRQEFVTFWVIDHLHKDKESFYKEIEAFNNLERTNLMTRGYSRADNILTSEKEEALRKKIREDEEKRIEKGKEIYAKSQVDRDEKRNTTGQGDYGGGYGGHRGGGGGGNQERHRVGGGRGRGREGIHPVSSRNRVDDYDRRIDHGPPPNRAAEYDRLTQSGNHSGNTGRRDYVDQGRSTLDHQQHDQGGYRNDRGDQYYRPER